MEKTARARLALCALTLYRGLLNDPVVKSFADLLETARGVDLRAFADAYGAFFARLVQSAGSPDFGACLTELIRFDDNAFTRLAVTRPVEDMEPGLLAAARHDLAGLAAAAELTAADLQTAAAENFAGVEGAEEMIGGLPAFSTGCACLAGPDPAETLADFHRHNGCGRFARFGAFKWSGGEGLVGIKSPDAVRLGELKGYEYERGVAVDNTLDFMDGNTANNLLLYGDRGTGKSSTVKAVFNEFRPRGLRIIEVTKECIGDFPLIVREILDIPLKFILFIDDLSFSSDDVSFSALKAVLEGGLAARPGNCVIYATSNRRHLVRETFAERDTDDVHAADAMQEKLSLADRFGITVTFSSPDQPLYFKIITAMARDRGLAVPQQELERGAAQWALRFNGRSPRAARQYVDWAQSRLKKGLPLTNF